MSIAFGQRGDFPVSRLINESIYGLQISGKDTTNTLDASSSPPAKHLSHFSTQAWLVHKCPPLHLDRKGSGVRVESIKDDEVHLLVRQVHVVSPHQGGNQYLQFNNRNVPAKALTRSLTEHDVVPSEIGQLLWVKPSLRIELIRVLIQFPVSVDSPW